MFQVNGTGDGFEFNIRGRVRWPDPVAILRRAAILVMTWEVVRHAPDLWSAAVMLARAILFGLPG